jgi:hypothetical protein
MWLAVHTFAPSNAIAVAELSDVIAPAFVTTDSLVENNELRTQSHRECSGNFSLGRRWLTVLLLELATREQIVGNA